MNQTAMSEESTLKILTLDESRDLCSETVRREALETLENGGVVFLPKCGFELTAAEREMIADTRAMLDGIRGAGHPQRQTDDHLRAVARQDQEAPLRVRAGKLVRAQVSRSPSSRISRR